MRATRFVWEVLGRPAPHEWNGEPVPPRKGIPAGAQCAICEETTRVEYTRKDAFSTNAYPPTQMSEMFPAGGPYVCAGCVYYMRAHLFKCAGFWCTARGLEFYPTRRVAEGLGGPLAAWAGKGRPAVLDVLLSPPTPPFVAVLPLYGIAHGGETNVHRCPLPGPGGTIVVPADPLVRIQAKTCTPSVVSNSQSRYTLHVDVSTISVDVALWARLRVIVETILTDIVGYVGVKEARAAASTLRCPPRPLAVVATWAARVEPLRPYADLPWWETFVELCEPGPRAEAPTPVAPETPAPTPAPAPAPQPVEENTAACPPNPPPPKAVQLRLF